MATADAWPRSGARPGRASADARPGRRSSADRAPRPQSSRRSPEPPRADIPRGRVEDRYRQAPLEQPRPAARERAIPSPAQSGSGGRIRGIVAVVGMFLVTLGAAAADSFLGVGLGTLTQVALVAATALAALLVRRNDIVTVVVAPPLVFLAVAAVNIGLAPSASFNLPTIATLLVRGFPTMGIATGVALVLALVRLVSRR